MDLKGHYYIQYLVSSIAAANEEVSEVLATTKDQQSVSSGMRGTYTEHTPKQKACSYWKFTWNEWHFKMEFPECFLHFAHMH